MITSLFIETRQELIDQYVLYLLFNAGREIFTVKAYNTDDSFLGTWIDAGCNTLLVESISILD